jgi:toxin ParE1/3/4
LRISWTKAASEDLDSFYNYIFLDNPTAAAKMVKRIVNVIEEHLADNPWPGHSCRLPKTREFAVIGTPYIIIYRVKEEKLEIIRLLHHLSFIIFLWNHWETGPFGEKKVKDNLAEQIGLHF